MPRNPFRKPNHTPFAKDYARTRPEIEVVSKVPRPTTKPTRELIPRLSFGHITPKLDSELSAITNSILTRSAKDSVLFPDTGFVTTAIPENFWRTAASRSVAFSEATVAELSGWRENPLRNQDLHSWLSRALTKCEQTDLSDDSIARDTCVNGLIGSFIEQFNVAVFDRQQIRNFGYDYYLNYLSLRKRLGIRAYRDLERTIGQAPTDPQFKQYLNNTFGPRTVGLAFKGWKDHGKRNYLADEELVLTAIISAIVTGRESIILTRDTDIFEQFADAVSAMSSQYSSHRCGECHFHNPAHLPLKEMTVGSEVQRFGIRAGKANALSHLIDNCGVYYQPLTIQLMFIVCYSETHTST